MGRPERGKAADQMPSEMIAKKSFCFSKHHHQSKSEAEYCNWLLARKQGGEIFNFKVWPSVDLMLNGKLWKRWKIDFQVFENDGTTSFHESKGWNRSDDSFKLKRDAFILQFPMIKLYVNKELWTGKVDRKRHRWTLAEVSRRNKRAAESRKRMAVSRREFFNKKRLEFRRDSSAGHGSETKTR